MLSGRFPSKRSEAQRRPDSCGGRTLWWFFSTGWRGSRRESSLATRRCLLLGAGASRLSLEGVVLRRAQFEATANTARIRKIRNARHRLARCQVWRWIGTASPSVSPPFHFFFVLFFSCFASRVVTLECRMQQSHDDEVFRVHWRGAKHRHGDWMAYFFHVLMIVQRGNVRLFWFIEYEQELDDGTLDLFGGSVTITGTSCFPRECERSQSPSRGLSDHAHREHWFDERKQHAIAGDYQRLRPVDSPASQRSSYFGCTLLSLFFIRVAWRSSTSLHVRKMSCVQCRFSGPPALKLLSSLQARGRRSVYHIDG